MSSNARTSTDVVIFDVDGTLVDTTYLHALAWVRAFAADDQVPHVPMWQVHRAIGMGGDMLVPHLLGDKLDEERGDALRDAWQKEYEPLRTEVVALPGAADLVRALHSQGFTIALASSGEEDYVEDAIKTLGIRDVVDLQISHGDVEASKPNPDLLLVTIARSGAERAVMVGDSPYDVMAAEKAGGLKTVTVRTGGFHQAELEHSGAEVVVDDLTEALDLDWAGLMTPISAETKAAAQKQSEAEESKSDD